jgi:predicted metal-dependent hydrolase
VTAAPSLVLGDLTFEVHRSDHRKTLGLTIERDGRLVLVAPNKVPTERLERFVRAKRFWVYTKLAARALLPPPAPPKQFVSGEGFPYLGRFHRLLLVTGLDAPVKLEAGRFKMARAEARQGRLHMVRWYSSHAGPWLEARVKQHAAKLRVTPGSVTVQDLGYRWGSCGKGGSLFFHWQVIPLPPRIIEYVVVHELVHLREPHHTPGFWRTLERAMPDWEERRTWLALHGHEYMV